MNASTLFTVALGFAIGLLGSSLYQEKERSATIDRHGEARAMQFVRDCMEECEGGDFTPKQPLLCSDIGAMRYAEYISTHNGQPPKGEK